MSSSILILSAAMTAAFTAEPRFTALETQEHVISYAPRAVLVAQNESDSDKNSAVAIQETTSKTAEVVIVTSLEEEEQILEPVAVAVPEPAVTEASQAAKSAEKTVKAKPAQKKKKRVATVACPK